MTWQLQGNLNGPAGAVDVRRFGAVGDGVTDDSAALESALASRKAVSIPDGLTVLVGDVRVGDGCSVFGPGVIKKAAGASSGLILEGEGASLSGLTFLGENTSGEPNSDVRLAEGASNVLIHGCRFRTSTYSAIAAAFENDLSNGIDNAYTTPVDGVMIHGNTFSGEYSRPLFIHSVKNLSIKGNTFRGCRFDAIRLRDMVGWTAINGNFFIDIGDPTWPDSQTRDAIDVYWSGTDLVIANNVVNTTAVHGFDIKGARKTDGSLRTQRVIILGNRIDCVKGAGIYLSGDYEFGATGYEGVNDIPDGSHDVPLDHVTIADNIITRANRGRWKKDTTYAPGDWDGSGASVGGIQVAGPTRYLNIHDNHISECYGNGITFYAEDATAEAPVNRFVMIHHNTVTNCGVSSWATPGHGASGIYIVNTGHLDLDSNHVVNDVEMPNAYMTTGIYISRYSSSNLVAENVATGTDTNSNTVGFSSTGTSASVSSSTDWAAEGSRSLKITANASTTSNRVAIGGTVSASDGSIPVSPLRTYRSSFVARAGASTSGDSVSAFFAWYQADKTTPSAITPNTFFTAQAISSSANTTFLLEDIVPPSDAQYVVMVLRGSTGIAATDVWYVDSIVFEAIVPRRTISMRDNKVMGCFTEQFSAEPNLDRTSLFSVYRDNTLIGPQGLRSWQSQRKEVWGGSAPTSAEGYWEVGDVVRNSSPAEGGVDHWVCTSAGRPGKWAPVGTIGTPV